MIESKESEYKVQDCPDGSRTIYSSQFEQCYHNPNGALTESLYVFFEKGKVAETLTKNGEINILEIGFGTGLNAWILGEWMDSKFPRSHASFYSVEAYPLSIQEALSCGYSKKVRMPNLPGNTRNVFEQIQNPGLHSFEFSSRYNLEIWSGLFEKMPKPENAPDVIFFDAFSPEKNQELWTTKVFKKLLSWSKSNTIMTTYSASTAARASMVEAGWMVAKTKGVLGKREMTIAALNEEHLSEHKLLNHKRLLQRRAIGEI